jgi:predicted metal-dependent enzyme (double-stranded beta helix superfamily)
MRLFIGIYLFHISCFAIAQQFYPNIDGKIIIDDDRVTVQHFVLQPGQWEGIHEHPEHQLVIVLNSTDELTYRFRGSEKVFTGSDDPDSDDMSGFWRPGPVLMSDEHESGNTGSRPLEWIAITFKNESIATDDPPAQFVNTDD